MVKFFLERCNTHLSTPHMEPKTDQSTDTTNVRHGEPLLVLGLCTEIWVKGEIKITEEKEKAQMQKNGIIYVKEG